jgi:tetratricopeptide (TPR) repeat protein
MLLVALMLAGQQTTPDPLPPVQADVVITGNRMLEALKKCLARRCTPEEEVEAAMNAGAENFAAGRYEEAKTILRQAISRNKKYGKLMPGPVSDLYATYADVTEHQGDIGAFRLATRESVDVLRRALGRGHPVALGASARVGDMWVKLGKTTSADSSYKEAAEDARRAGHPDMAAALTFRRAWLALGARDLARSRRLLADLEQSHGSDPRFAGLLRVLKARIAIARGDTETTDELVAALRGAGGAAPVLIYEPPYPAFHAGGRSGMTTSGEVDIEAAWANGASLRGEILWADVGYWVRPDGRPGEIEILRPARNSEWAKPLVKHISARRYAPARETTGGVGTYRVERFTLRSAFDVPTGSRIKQRTGTPTLHVIDLTQLAQREGGTSER